MDNKKFKGDDLIKDLIYKKKNFFEIASVKEIENCFNFAEEYKEFLNASKTEREACKFIVNMAKEAGFKEFKFSDKLKKGDKRYFVNREKSVVLFKIGNTNLEENGMRLIGAHIDSPRLDLKQNPFYESDGFCFLKTHYYGGIKKYQWTTIPLSLHGVVIIRDGSKVEINIGEKEDEPVFYINDLLPHLAQSQMKKSGGELISGEQLNIVFGGQIFKDTSINEKIKANILKILFEKYGIREADFMSAELCAVPSMKARDVGLDRTFIAGYGHDDKSCAYPAVKAILDAKNSDTVMALLVDKEEIGSEGSTGMKCKVYEDLIDEICTNFNALPRKVRANSKCLSADVTSAYDPNFAEVYEKSNSAMISHGVAVNKFTGARGKSDASDASAELVGEIKKLFDDKNILWQSSELGKVDIGGGGTIAKYVAGLNIDTLDLGVPVISMHAPYELISKADLYSAYQAFKTFNEK